MTPRAIMVGLLAVVVLNAVCYFNDMVLRQSYLVGSYLPIPIMGGMLLLILIANPLLYKLHQRWAWRGAEQATTLAIILAACWVPGRGLMHYFTTVQMLPNYFVKLFPGWQSTEILALIPPRMLADGTVNGGKALGEFLQGAKVDNPNFWLLDIPWSAWWPSLSFWIPLFLTIAAALLGLALVVHRQWSEHEHLAYPICSFANAIFSQEDGRASPLVRDRGFWVGLSGVLAIHLYNYACTWFPRYLMEIPLTFDFRTMLEMFPTLNVGGAGQLFYPTLFFTVIGFAYFLPSEVSLSLGVAGFAFCWVVGLLSGYGIVVTGQHLSLRLESFMHGGSLFGVLLVLLYTGRHYYLQVTRRALAMPGSVGVVPNSAVWGMRIFFLGSAAFAGQLAMVGLDWPLAILYTFGTIHFPGDQPRGG